MGIFLKGSHSAILYPFVFKRTTTTASTGSSQTVSSDAVASASPGGRSAGTSRSHYHFNRKRNSVSFGEITVREYDRSLGDCWDMPYGLGIGWDYYEHASAPIPDEDQEEASRYIGKLRKDKIKKFRSKIMAMLLVNHNKMHSNGEIKAESIRRLDTSDRKKLRRKSKKKISLHYEDQPCTASIRKKLLQEFGYPTNELILSESERQRIRFEYNMWMTRPIKKMSSSTTSSSDDDRPSKLLIDRVLADILHTIPDSTTTVTNIPTPSGGTTNIINTPTTTTTSCCSDCNWSS